LQPPFATTRPQTTGGFTLRTLKHNNSASHLQAAEKSMAKKPNLDLSFDVQRIDAITEMGRHHKARAM